MILTNTGVLKLMQRIKSFIASQLNTKAASVHTHSISEIDNLASQLGEGYSKSEVDTLLNGKADTSHTHTKSEITDFPSLATVATSGSYADLSNKPSIPVIDSALSSTSTNGLQNKVINSALDGKANSTHTHSASDITSGTLNTDRIPNLDASKITSGTIDIARLPAGALERLVTVADQTARFNLTINDVQLGDTVKQLDTGIMYYVIDTSNLNSESGYTEYTAGSATSVPWSGVTGKPSAFTPSSHTHSASDITSGLSSVATSGSYSDLTNKPSIPSKTSDLTNDSGYITGADLLPIGSYIQFAGSQAPAGFLVCNGGAISRTTYSALFAVIGTTYGSGDGWSTFNLPNLTDRFLQGSTTSGTVKNAGLPNITGYTGTIPYLVDSVSYGSLDYTNTGSDANLIGNPPGSPLRYINLDASRSNSIYGSSATVQPPALTCLICIKY